MGASEFNFKESVMAPGYSVATVNLLNIEKAGLVEADSRWCLWFAEFGKEHTTKPAKVPCNADLRRISVTSLKSWLTWGQTGGAYASGRFDGVGLLMSSATGLVGLDLDKCLELDGTITPGKESIAADFLALGGYIERSPSGFGLRQFLRGVAPDGYVENNGAGLEVYDSNSSRYLTLTGQIWPEGSEPGMVKENQSALEGFMSRWCKRKPVVAPLQFDAGQSDGAQRSAEEVLKLMRTYNKRGQLTRLLAGEVGDSGGHSEADAALCFETAYFCRDPIVIDAVMRGSGLMRSKWDERRGRETYGALTIRNALKAQTRNHDTVQAEKLADGQAMKLDGDRIRNKGAENLIGGLDGLLTAKRQIKSDTWALTELLLRDRRLLGACHYDEFSGFPVFNLPLADAMGDKSAPFETGRISDDHVLAFLRWYGREWGLSLKLDQVRAAVLGLASAVRINPVRTKLEELEAAWDQVPRLDDWLIHCLKAPTQSEDGRDITDYLRAVGSRWVISAVARAFTPGCKADAMLVLEGRQGARKSSAVRVLFKAVGAEYFREGFCLGAGKDDLVALRGKWGVEWGELGGMGKRDRNELKTFLTQQTDSYRQSYGVFEKDWPRTAVFCGTTNEGGYLSDPTGNRRFWPVTVGRIDLDGLRRDAEMLWAEAVTRYKAGSIWWLDDADPRDMRLLAMAEREQSQRIGGTFWSEIAANLADRLVLGRLAAMDKDGRLSEAEIDRKFSVNQMRAWLSTQTEDRDGAMVGGDNEAHITDANWPKVCDGLRIAGWESRKSNGVMKWSLTPERRDELCLLHGREVGPKISPMKRARREVQPYA